MIDNSLVVSALVESEMESVRSLADKYGARYRLDPDDAESRACLALWKSAEKFAVTQSPLGVFAVFAARAVRQALREYGRGKLMAWLKPVPVRLRPAAIRCRRVLDRLAARGMKRPGFAEIAWEAGLAEEDVVKLATIPGVLVRQTLVEWSEDHAAPRLIDPENCPLFPVLAFTPQSYCPHFGRIEDGSILVCMTCHDTGQRKHPSLKRSKATDPKPESKQAPPPKVEKPKVETRAERRKRLFPPRLDVPEKTA